MQAVQSISTGGAGDTPGKSHDLSASAATRIIRDVGPLLNELDDASGEIVVAGGLVEALIALIDNTSELYGVDAGAKRQLRHAGTVLRLLGRQLEHADQRVEEIYTALGRAPGVEA